MVKGVTSGAKATFYEAPGGTIEVVPFPSPFTRQVPGKQSISLKLEVNNIQDDVRAPIQEHHMPTDNDVSTSSGRRGQTPLDFFRTGQHFFAQAGRQSSLHAQLFFQPRRQPIALGQSWRKVIIAVVLVIPVPHGIPVMFTVIVAILVVPIVLAMSVAMAIAERHSCRAEHCRQSETQTVFPQNSTLLSLS